MTIISQSQVEAIATRTAESGELGRLAAAVREAVRDARSDCHRWALREFGNCLRSRGAHIRVAARATNDLIAGEAESWEYKGTVAELGELLRDYVRRPDVGAIYIDGGFDWAESPRAFADFNYDPWVAEWSVAVWIYGEDDAPTVDGSAMQARARAE